jgi:hypothetical protein
VVVRFVAFLRRSVVNGYSWGRSTITNALDIATLLAVVGGLPYVLIARGHNGGLLPPWGVAVILAALIVASVLVGTYRTWDETDRALADRDAEIKNRALDVLVDVKDMSADIA